MNGNWSIIRKQRKKGVVYCSGQHCLGYLKACDVGIAARIQSILTTTTTKIDLEHTEVRNVHVIVGILKRILFQLMTMSIFRFQFNL